jgi:hypothetical protein
VGRRFSTYRSLFSVRLIGLFLLLIFLSAGCNPKCYDCIVTEEGTQEKDTVNVICTDDAQYSGSYFQSWKVACEIAGGETVVREGE